MQTAFKKFFKKFFRVIFHNEVICKNWRTIRSTTVRGKKSVNCESDPPSDLGVHQCVLAPMTPVAINDSADASNNELRASNNDHTPAVDRPSAAFAVIYFLLSKTVSVSTQMITEP